MAGYNRSLEAVQSVAYTASIDVDPDMGEYVVIGPLTGALTITAANGRAIGKRLIFDMTQDGTGGRVVTWDAIFKAGAFAPVTTANKRNIVAFLFDGTNYVMQSQAAGV